MSAPVSLAQRCFESAKGYAFSRERSCVSIALDKIALIGHLFITLCFETISLRAIVRNICYLGCKIRGDSYSETAKVYSYSQLIFGLLWGYSPKQLELLGKLQTKPLERAWAVQLFKLECMQLGVCIPLASMPSAHFLQITHESLLTYRSKNSQETAVAFFLEHMGKEPLTLATIERLISLTQDTPLPAPEKLEDFFA